VTTQPTEPQEEHDRIHALLAKLEQARTELAAVRRIFSIGHDERTVEGAERHYRMERESFAGAHRRIAELKTAREITYRERDEARAALAAVKALCDHYDWNINLANAVSGVAAGSIAEEFRAALSASTPSLPAEATPDSHALALAREVLDEHDAGRSPLPSTVCELAARVLRLASGVPTPTPERQVLEFLFARHEARRLMERPRCYGASSDALAYYGAGKRGEPTGGWDFPSDPGDLGACERTYDMAPGHIKQRMLPVLEKFREHVAERYPEVVSRKEQQA
jgi:hypothetical protein